MTGIPAARRPVVAITQARIGSSRLPRKVLLPVAGRPLLWWHLTRLKRALTLDRIVVATTGEPGSDRIVAIADELGIGHFRGSVDDVLARFEGAAGDARTVVRVTSDCPLIDPALLDAAVADYASGEAGYVSLDVARYPRGLDCEVFPRAALSAAVANAVEPHDREHVTPYIRRHAACRYLAPPGPVEPHRWCVDTADDLALVERVLDAIGGDPGFGWRDVVSLLDRHPEWRVLNRHVVQKPQ